jgi:hypothetical protein
MREARKQKMQNVKYDPDELLKKKGILSDKMSYADDLLKMNELPKIQISL